MDLEHAIIARQPPEATLEGSEAAVVAIREVTEETVALEEVNHKSYFIF